jgi:hypothetical protein
MSADRTKKVATTMVALAWLSDQISDQDVSGRRETPGVSRVIEAGSSEEN